MEQDALVTRLTGETTRAADEATEREQDRAALEYEEKRVNLRVRDGKFRVPPQERADALAELQEVETQLHRRYAALTEAEKVVLGRRLEALEILVQRYLQEQTAVDLAIN
jgi:hypothetical protein